MKRFLILLLVLPGLAAAASPTPLSLDDAEKLWRRHSRELRLADIAVAGAAADLKTADRLPNPELSYNAASISPSEGYGSGHLKDKRMDSIVRLEQLIERGGKRELRVRGAESRLAAAGLDREDVARTQLGDLRRAYYDLLLAQERLRVAADSAALYARSLDAAELRRKAGDIAPVDVARLAVDKARADNEARQAESDLDAARRQLAYLIGREDDAASLLATDAWPQPLAGDPGRPDLARRPDLRAGSERIAAAEADRDLARALRTRDVSVGLQVERNLQNSPTNSFGVGISVPLFLWHGHEGEIQRAESDLDAARLAYEQQKAQATGQAGQARSALLAARDRLLRLENGLLADARRVAEAAELAYGKGAMGLMDLLDARRTLRQVQLEAATARADYAKALADWQLQAGYGKPQEPDNLTDGQVR